MRPSSPASPPPSSCTSAEHTRSRVLSSASSSAPRTPSHSRGASASFMSTPRLSPQTPRSTHHARSKTATLDGQLDMDPDRIPDQQEFENFQQVKARYVAPRKSQTYRNLQKASYVSSSPFKSTQPRVEEGSSPGAAEQYLDEPLELPQRRHYHGPDNSPTRKATGSGAVDTASSSPLFLSSTPSPTPSPTTRSRPAPSRLAGLELTGSAPPEEPAAAPSKALPAFTMAPTKTLERGSGARASSAATPSWKQIARRAHANPQPLSPVRSTRQTAVSMRTPVRPKASRDLDLSHPSTSTLRRPWLDSAGREEPLHPCSRNLASSTVTSTEVSSQAAWSDPAGTSCTKDTTFNSDQSQLHRLTDQRSRTLSLSAYGDHTSCIRPSGRLEGSPKDGSDSLGGQLKGVQLFDPPVRAESEEEEVESGGNPSVVSTQGNQGSNLPRDMTLTGLVRLDHLMDQVLQEVHGIADPHAADGSKTRARRPRCSSLSGLDELQETNVYQDNRVTSISSQLTDNVDLERGFANEQASPSAAALCSSPPLGPARPSNFGGMFGNQLDRPLPPLPLNTSFDLDATRDAGAAKPGASPPKGPRDHEEGVTKGVFPEAELNEVQTLEVGHDYVPLEVGESTHSISVADEGSRETLHPNKAFIAQSSLEHNSSSPSSSSKGTPPLEPSCQAYPDSSVKRESSGVFSRHSKKSSSELSSEDDRTDTPQLFPQDRFGEREAITTADQTSSGHEGVVADRSKGLASYAPVKSTSETAKGGLQEELSGANVGLADPRETIAPRIPTRLLNLGSSLGSGLSLGAGLGLGIDALSLATPTPTTAHALTDDRPSATPPTGETIQDQGVSPFPMDRMPPTVPASSMTPSAEPLLRTPAEQADAIITRRRMKRGLPTRPRRSLSVGATPELLEPTSTASQSEATEKEKEHADQISQGNLKDAGGSDMMSESDQHAGESESSPAQRHAHSGNELLSTLDSPEEDEGFGFGLQRELSRIVKKDRPYKMRKRQTIKVGDTDVPFAPSAPVASGESNRTLAAGTPKEPGSPSRSLSPAGSQVRKPRRSDMVCCNFNMYSK